MTGRSTKKVWKKMNCCCFKLNPCVTLGFDRSHQIIVFPALSQRWKAHRQGVASLAVYSFKQFADDRSVQTWEVECVHSFSVFLFQKWIDISIEPSCYFHWLNEFLSAPHCASVLEKHMAHLTLNYGFIYFLLCIFHLWHYRFFKKSHIYVYIYIW